MPTGSLAKRYHPIRLLGEGGMGKVWLVMDAVEARQVALKALPEATGASAGAVLQMKQEFRAMAHLRHPNCCAVYDYGLLPEGSPYFTMEVVDGHGLDELLPLDGRRFREVFSQLLLALGYVHQQGFVHCDIKSQNVRVQPDGTVKLMDFGLMEHSGRSGGPIKGTLGYIAPEVAKRGRLDPRTDLYSVGALAYEALTGRLPFSGKTPLEVLRAHLDSPPVPPSRWNAAIDPALEAIVLKLLAKEPLERYQSAYEVLRELGTELPPGIGGQLLACPLIGRAPESAQLLARVARLKAGEPAGALTIEGPTGVGKSRLVEELRVALQLEEIVVAVGSALDQDQAPYGPFLAVLKALMPAIKMAIPDALAQHAPVLAKLMPELGPAAEALDTPIKEKVRLHDAITDLLVQLARARGFAVIIEDWHRADALSQELARVLARQLATQRALLVFTSRAETELEGVERLALPMLDRAAIGEMMAAMLGTREIAAGFVDRIGELSGGLPRYVERLLEHLVAAGILVSTGGHWQTAIELSGMRLPAGLQGLLRHQIDGLSEGARALANLAAVIGRDVAIEVLEATSRLEEEPFFAALELLQERQILLQEEPGIYRFVQEALQALLLEQLPEAEARARHMAVMATLERQGAEQPLAAWPLDRVTAIARHAMAAGSDEAIARYALEAGIRHARWHALAEAERYLEAGLAVMRRCGAGERRQETFAYLRELGDVKRLAGDMEAARALLAEAVTLAEALGEHFHLGRLLTSLAKIDQVRNDDEAALAACERSIALCEAHGDPSGAARALMTRARIHFRRRGAAAAIADTEQGLARALAGCDALVTGLLYGQMGYFYVAALPEKLSEGIAHLDRALATFQAANDKIGLYTTYDLKGNAQLTLGDFEAAWETFGRAQQLCAEVGAQEEESFARLNMAIAAYERGRFEAASEHAGHAQALAGKANSRLPLGLALAIEAAACAQRGDFARAHTQLVEAQTVAEAAATPYLTHFIGLYEVEIALSGGRLAAAGRLAGPLGERLQAAGEGELENRLALLVGEWHARQGELAEAEAIARRVRAAAEQAHASGLQGRAARLDALIALLREDWKSARERSEAALALARRCGARGLEAELLGWLGEIDLALGNGQAGEHFDAMEAIAREHRAATLQAIAHFGQAAARPYGETATELAGRARDALTAIAASLEPEARADFLTQREHARVIAGNFIAFSLKRVREPGTARSGPLGLWSMG